MITPDLVGSTQDVVIMLGDQQITGKSFIVRGINISMGELVCFDSGDGSLSHLAPSGPCDIEIGLTGYPNALETMLNEQKRKVSSKIIRDATILELLFAVRKKIKNGG